MYSEIRATQNGNEKYLQSAFTSSFPKNPRKGSQHSTFDKLDAQTEKSRKSWTYQKNQRQRNPRKPSFTDEAVEYQVVACPGHTEDQSTPRGQASCSGKEETQSTSSSTLGYSSPVSSEPKAIDDFKIVVLGHVIDGVKVKGLHLHKFAAANLCKPPEASSLQMPEF